MRMNHLIASMTVLFFSASLTFAQIQTTSTVATSFYPIYIATLNLTYNIPHIRLFNLIKPSNGCLHDYQMTPNDLATLNSSHLFIINGAGLESFIGKVAHQIPNLGIVDASAGISQQNNPHIWVSLSEHMEQIKNISSGLQKVFPTDKLVIKSNMNAYLSKISVLRAQMIREIAPYKNSPIVTFHEAFPYLAKDLSLKVIANIEKESGTNPSAHELADLIKLIRQQKAKAIFTDPHNTNSIAATISKETAVPVYTLDPITSGPLDKDAYLKIMQNNLLTLKRALAK